MTTPDRLTCPCCGAAIDPAHPLDALEARCEQREDNETGALISCRLYWRCRVCGCMWLHGQEFCEKETKGATTV